MVQLIGLLVLMSGLVGQVSAASEIDPIGEVCHGIQDTESMVEDATSLIQSSIQTHQAEEDATRARVRLLFGRALHQDVTQAPPPSQAALMVPTGKDIISPTFWSNAQATLNRAGFSTPSPRAAFINAPPAKAAETPWESVMNEAKQPLNTRLGGAIIYGLSGGVTPTPPPTQAAIDMQFVAQCPMVLFNRNLSIRAPSCNHTRGQWIDPSPLNPRAVLRWEVAGDGKLKLGTDSAIDGLGAALFADITQDITLNSYKFKMTNCLGVDRWEIEELVYKVDSMGQVSSTLELHDVSMNRAAYFYRYLVRKPSGELVAQSTLYRLGHKQLNFTTMKNGFDTGELMATATKQGIWERKGWEECMSPTSPRAWNLYFPPEKGATTSATSSHPTQATVQDIRVAFTGAITLMAHRDELRGADGLNTEGGTHEKIVIGGGAALICVILLLLTNFCMVFKASGLSQKLRKTLFDAEGALLPAAPSAHRTPPLNPSY